MKALLAVLTAFYAFPAVALQCAHTNTVEQRLIIKYGEAVVDEKYVAPERTPRPRAHVPTVGYTIRLWYNAKTETWTLTLTQGPLTCLAATGRGLPANPVIGDAINPASSRL